MPLRRAPHQPDLASGVGSRSSTEGVHLLSIALCIAIPPFLIWGTVFGVLRLLTLVGSKRLFGPDRISLAQLRDEVNYRKANNVA